MTNMYVCVGGEKGECKKLDTISNRESKILLSRIFLLGVGKLRGSDFDHLMYYVSYFDKQHGAAIFLKKCEHKFRVLNKLSDAFYR